MNEFGEFKLGPVSSVNHILYSENNLLNLFVPRLSYNMFLLEKVPAKIFFILLCAALSVFEGLSMMQLFAKILNRF